MAVLLNLSIVENSGIAISYDIALRKHIAQLARQRRTDIDYAKLLSEECFEVKKQIYSSRSSQKVEDKGKGKGDKGKGKRAKDSLPINMRPISITSRIGTRTKHGSTLNRRIIIIRKETGTRKEKKTEISISQTFSIAATSQIEASPFSSAIARFAA